LGSRDVGVLVVPPRWQGGAHTRRDARRLSRVGALPPVAGAARRRGRRRHRPLNANKRHQASWIGQAEGRGDNRECRACHGLSFFSSACATHVSLSRARAANAVSSTLPTHTSIAFSPTPAAKSERNCTGPAHQPTHARVHAPSPLARDAHRQSLRE